MQTKSVNTWEYLGWTNSHRIEDFNRIEIEQSQCRRRRKSLGFLTITVEWSSPKFHSTRHISDAIVIWIQMSDHKSTLMGKVSLQPGTPFRIFFSFSCFFSSFFHFAKKIKQDETILKSYSIFFIITDDYSSASIHSCSEVFLSSFFLRFLYEKHLQWDLVGSMLMQACLVIKLIKFYFFEINHNSSKVKKQISVWISEPYSNINRIPLSLETRWIFSKKFHLS